MEKLGKTFNWCSYELLVRSTTGLAGEAREWFSTWKPLDKSWEEFRRELSSLNPAKRNLNEKLRKASQYTSKDAKSYCEYARKKIFLLNSLNFDLSIGQILEIVIGDMIDIPKPT